MFVEWFVVDIGLIFCFIMVLVNDWRWIDHIGWLVDHVWLINDGRWCVINLLDYSKLKPCRMAKLRQAARISVLQRRPMTAEGFSSSIGIIWPFTMVINIIGINSSNKYLNKVVNWYHQQSRGLWPCPRSISGGCFSTKEWLRLWSCMSTYIDWTT